VKITHRVFKQRVMDLGSLVLPAIKSPPQPGSAKKMTKGELLLYQIHSRADPETARQHRIKEMEQSIYEDMEKQLKKKGKKKVETVFYSIQRVNEEIGFYPLDIRFQTGETAAKHKKKSTFHQKTDYSRFIIVLDKNGVPTIWAEMCNEGACVVKSEYCPRRVRVYACTSVSNIDIQTEIKSLQSITAIDKSEVKKKLKALKEENQDKNVFLLAYEELEKGECNLFPSFFDASTL